MSNISFGGSMNYNENIRNNIQRLRKENNIKQETLAEALNISVQAISKWETGASLPDILQLPAIARFFNISIDYLFYNMMTSESCEINALPDDNILRIVQFNGKKMLCSDNWEKDKEIVLRIDKNFKTPVLNVEIQGNASILGDVGGYVEADGNINCGNINSYVECGGNVNCGNIGSYVECGENVNCGNIGSYVECGDSVHCTNISGYVECGGNVKCEMISDK